MVEIFIGGWNNKKLAIRLNGTKPDKFEQLTSDIVKYFLLGYYSFFFRVRVSLPFFFSFFLSFV